MTPKLEWRQARTRYAHGEDCWAGRIKVGSASYGMVTRGDPNVWVGETTLPGLTPKGPTHFATIEEAKARVERLVAFWFEAILSQEPNQHV